MGKSNFRKEKNLEKNALDPEGKNVNQELECNMAGTNAGTAVPGSEGIETLSIRQD